MTIKFDLYAKLGIPEYLLVDPSGCWLSQRLLRIRFQPNGSFQIDQDGDGGVTSELGFRLVLEGDGQLRVLDTVSGVGYRRPEEAEEMARFHRQANAQTPGDEKSGGYLEGGVTAPWAAADCPKKETVKELTMTKQLYIETVGCQMNVLDSELVVAVFAARATN